jgi:hypothetical protein
MPTSRGGEEGGRDGEDEVGLELPAAEIEAGNMEGETEGGKPEAGVEDVLDDVTGVGAHGDQLAMGHIDDAHEAEGDGEAEGDHEEDGPEAEAAEEGAEEIDAADVALDEPEGVLGGLDFTGRGSCVAHDGGEDVAGGDGNEIAKLLDGGNLDGGIGILELDDGDGLGESFLDLGVAFLGDAGLEDGDVGRVLDHPELHDRGTASLGIGIVEGHQVEGVLDGLFQPQVGIHGVEVIGEEGLGLAGGVVEVAAGVDADGLLLAVGILGVFEHHGDFCAVAAIDQEDFVVGPCDEDLADEIGIGIGEGGDEFELVIAIGDDGFAEELADRRRYRRRGRRESGKTGRGKGRRCGRRVLDRVWSYGFAFFGQVQVQRNDCAKNNEGAETSPAPSN